MNSTTLLLSLLLFVTSCNSNKSSKAGDQQGAWNPPPAGAVVAADSMKIDDPLNEFYFAVSVTVSHENEIATGDYGFVYDVTTHYGPGTMTGQITMPAGGKTLKPLLHKSPQGYRYLIGFIAGEDLGGDGKTFQELYSVEGSKETIVIKPLKSYRFR